MTFIRLVRIKSLCFWQYGLITVNLKESYSDCHIHKNWHKHSNIECTLESHQNGSTLYSILTYLLIFSLHCSPTTKKCLFKGKIKRNILKIRWFSAHCLASSLFFINIKSNWVWGYILLFLAPAEGYNPAGKPNLRGGAR